MKEIGRVVNFASITVPSRSKESTTIGTTNKGRVLNELPGKLREGFTWLVLTVNLLTETIFLAVVSIKHIVAAEQKGVKENVVLRGPLVNSRVASSKVEGAVTVSIRYT